MRPGKRIALEFRGRKVTSVGVDTVLGKRHFNGVDEESRFLSAAQFRLYPDSEGWMICHDTSATNATLLNGKAVTSPKALSDGMRIAVGNSSKGVEKLPLTVRFLQEDTSVSDAKPPRHVDPVSEKPPSSDRDAGCYSAASAKEYTEPRARSARATSPGDHGAVGYDHADTVALEVGALMGESVQTLAALLKSNLPCGLLYARACYRWIAEHISYDISLLSSRVTRNKAPAEVMRDRTAICGGYANLYKALCNAGGIRCEVVSGFLKMGLVTVNLPEGPENHAWNAIQVDGDWHLIDATLGSGSMNASGSFERRFEPFYFATSPEFFVRDHFPGDAKWQLLNNRVRRSDFDSFISVKPRFYELGFEFVSPDKDNLACNETFEVSIKNPSKVALIGILTSDGRQIGGHIFAQKRDKLSEFRGALPYRGNFVFVLLAESETNRGMFESIAEYKITANFR